MQNFEKVKRQVEKLEQQWIDLEVQQWDIQAEAGASPAS
jgi:phage shock protein A